MFMLFSDENWSKAPLKIPTCPDALPNLSSDLLQVWAEGGLGPPVKCQTDPVPPAVSNTPRIERLL